MLRAGWVTLRNSVCTSTLIFFAYRHDIQFNYQLRREYVLSRPRDTLRTFRTSTRGSCSWSFQKHPDLVIPNGLDQPRFVLLQTFVASVLIYGEPVSKLGPRLCDLHVLGVRKPMLEAFVPHRFQVSLVDVNTACHLCTLFGNLRKMSPYIIRLSCSAFMVVYTWTIGYNARTKGGLSKCVPIFIVLNKGKFLCCKRRFTVLIFAHDAEKWLALKLWPMELSQHGYPKHKRTRTRYHYCVCKASMEKEDIHRNSCLRCCHCGRTWRGTRSWTSRKKPRQPANIDGR